MQIFLVNAFDPSNLAAFFEGPKALIPLAEASELFVHAGIARTVRAMVLMNLVDAYGDVPYSQAIDPNNFNPGVDKGADVYAAALADLNKAIENFNAKSKSGATTDLYYAGSTDSWIRLANTLKFNSSPILFLRSEYISE